MPWRITPTTTVDDAKREAKRWLKAVRAGEADAHARLRSVMPDAPTALTLREVQHVLAKEQGFPGWTELQQHLALASSSRRSTETASLERYERMAANLLDAFRSGTAESMERHWKDTWHRRAWKGMRRYVLADLGRQSDDKDQREDISLDDARLLVAREAGFESWSALCDFTASAPRDRRVFAKPLSLISVGSTQPDSGDPIRDWDTAIELLRSGAFAGLDASGQATDDLIDRLSQIEQVTSLKLANSRALTDDGLRHLARMPQLRHLDLSGCAIGDGQLSIFKELPALETISLSDTRVTDAGVAHLVKCERLRRVDLSWTRTGDDALTALAGKPELRDLRAGLDVTDAGLSRLRHFPMFRTWCGEPPTMALLGGDAGPTHLSLRCRITDEALPTIAALEGLFALNIHDGRMPITARGIRALATSANLGWLAYEATDDAMPAIAGIPKLQFLLSQDSKVSDEGWVSLSRSRSVEYIWGRDSPHLSGRGFLALSTMPSLRGLSVNLGNVNDEVLSALSEFPSLRELMPMGVADVGFRHVGACPNLKSLILMYCRHTTDAATERIVGLTKLSHYYASYTRITDRTPELLARITSLEQIELHGCAGVTNLGIAALASLPALKELSLSAMQHVDHGVRRVMPSTVRVRWST